jgi:flagellar hook-associated protein 2
MASISSPGLGSGLDVNSIVSQLVALERRPITVLQTQASTVQTKLSIYGQIQSKLSALRDAAAALSQPGTWGQTLGSSTDPAAIGVTTSSTTHAGRYSVMVTALAAAQSTASAVAYASADATMGEGTLDIELGTWNGTGFTPNAAASSVSVTIGPGARTLAQVRDAINAAQTGVTASVLNDASGARLVLRSTATGADNGFRVSVTDSDGGNGDTSGLSVLAYDPQAGVSAMTLAQGAANAQASIDNVPVTSASNTLASVIDGITLTLARVTAAPVQVDAASDQEAIRTKIDAFATAYNEVNSLLATQTRYDEGSKTAGALQGDSAALGIRSQLRRMLGTTSGASAVFTRLSDIGFDVKTDGSISVDATKLSNGLANLAEITELFSNSDPLVPANDGIAIQLRRLTDGMLAFDGTVQSHTEGLQARLELNRDRQERLEDRVVRVEARLRAQYAALDTQMTLLSGLSSYVQQQITNWNKSRDDN